MKFSSQRSNKNIAHQIEISIMCPYLTLPLLPQAWNIYKDIQLIDINCFKEAYCPDDPIFCATNSRRLFSLSLRLRSRYSLFDSKVLILKQ